MNNAFYYNITSSLITVIYSNGNLETWDNTFPAFDQVKEACINNEEKRLKYLGDIRDLMKKYANDINLVQHDDGEISISLHFAEDDLTFNLADEDPHVRLMKLAAKKLPGVHLTDALKKFLMGVVQNPYIKAAEELLQYCLNGDFEITEDGGLLAYKNVNKDLSSIHKSKHGKEFIHQPGAILVEDSFDTNRYNTCSEGLHFCSYGYLRSYPGDTTVIVKIFPIDIVSIPVDYNCMKGRCRKYEVVDILQKNKTLKDYLK